MDLNEFTATENRKGHFIRNVFCINVGLYYPNIIVNMPVVSQDRVDMTLLLQRAIVHQRVTQVHLLLPISESESEGQ